ncbi:uncharacterized protein L203_102435 [Cryptococcus depauperatus CBS 7841]|uniref:Uncharacterized protein n=1 Tax=Cryptococcus depauperatus CBS 7841 TaxID=1295531 RepID=A0A1E3HH16_9TREE|nr:hypothetical protein L203_06507 [Cryptococcus depauperatus CBS 7841]
MTLDISLPPELLSCTSLVSPFTSQTPVSGWKNPQAIKPWHTEYSLVFVVDKVANKLLLGLKKRGMGFGLYNGYGGKPEQGESMQDCAIRELYEESGLTVAEQDIYYKGLLLSSRPKARESLDTYLLSIHIYACMSWLGNPIETEEMAPKWFTMETLPIQKMWPEARLYVPAILDSILHDMDKENLLLARVNYEYLTATDAPTSFPPLQGTSIRFETDSIDNDVNQDSLQERLSGWWMAFVPRQILSKSSPLTRLIEFEETRKSRYRNSP